MPPWGALGVLLPGQLYPRSQVGWGKGAAVPAAGGESGPLGDKVGVCTFTPTHAYSCPHVFTCSLTPTHVKLPPELPAAVPTAACVCERCGPGGAGGEGFPSTWASDPCQRRGAERGLTHRHSHLPGGPKSHSPGGGASCSTPASRAERVTGRGKAGPAPGSPGSRALRVRVCPGAPGGVPEGRRVTSRGFPEGKDRQRPRCYMSPL